MRKVGEVLYEGERGQWQKFFSQIFSISSPKQKSKLRPKADRDERNNFDDFLNRGEKQDITLLLLFPSFFFGSIFRPLFPSLEEFAARERGWLGDFWTFGLLPPARPPPLPYIMGRKRPEVGGGSGRLQEAEEEASHS